MEWFQNHVLEAITLVAASGATLIQIAPIKVNPWSALMSWIGRAIGLEELKSTLDTHIRIDDERYAKSCRMRVLRFSDEILQGKKHTKEHFDEILDDITEYENYCKSHPDYLNNKAKMAIQNVENVYRECMRKNTFL